MDHALAFHQVPSEILQLRLPLWFSIRPGVRTILTQPTAKPPEINTGRTDGMKHPS